MHAAQAEHRRQAKLARRSRRTRTGKVRRATLTSARIKAGAACWEWLLARNPATAPAITVKTERRRTLRDMIGWGRKREHDARDDRLKLEQRAARSRLRLPFTRSR